MANNSVTVPPPPYRSPFVDNQMNITPAWSKWLNQLYVRVGGATAPSPSEVSSDILTLQHNVATLTSEVSALITENTTLTNLANALSVGRQL